MSETITITSETIAERLGQYFFRLTNFNVSQRDFNSSQIDFGFQPIMLYNHESGDTTVFEIMLASESLLAREWNSPDEDDAWAIT